MSINLIGRELVNHHVVASLSTMALGNPTATIDAVVNDANDVVAIVRSVTLAAFDAGINQEQRIFTTTPALPISLTNLLAYSEQADQWFLSGGTLGNLSVVNTDVAADPFGGNATDEITHTLESPARNIRMEIQQNVALDDFTDYNVSIFSKQPLVPDNANHSQIFATGSPAQPKVAYDMRDGGVSLISGPAFNTLVTTEDNGFYRCSFAFNTSTNASLFTVRHRVADGTGSGDDLVDSDVPHTLHWVGMQLTKGALVKPYQQTGATVQSFDTTVVGTVGPNDTDITASTATMALSGNNAIVSSSGEELLYPITYSARGASRSAFVDQPQAAIDRLAIGMMDAHHSIGLDSGTAMDTTPPAPGYLSRADAYKEILAGDLGSEHYVFCYHNVTEAIDLPTPPRTGKIQAYVDSLESQNSSRDGWWYNGGGSKVILFANQYGLNISDEIAPKFYADTGTNINYCEWYAREMAQKAYFDVQIAEGLTVGKGGVNIFLDNYQHHANKQSVDWDNLNGTNNNALNYWDLEADNHNWDDKSCTITRSGSTATITTAVPHPLENVSDPHILVEGANQSDYNGVFTDTGGGVNIVNDTTITYTVSGSPTTPATGTITFSALDNNSEKRSIAATHFSQVRTNMRLSVETWDAANPGTVTLVNTNQWMDRTGEGLRNSFETDPHALRDCILEFRQDGNPLKSSTQSGFSENNVKNPNPDFPGPGESQNFPRCGVGYNGLNAGQVGSWLATFCNMYQSVRLSQFPHIVAGAMGCECLQPAVSAGYPVNTRSYPNVPISSTNWHMARWGMVTAWLAGAYAACHGIRPGTEGSGGGNATVLWDELGLINGAVNYNGFGAGPTKLFHKWMGAAKESSPLDPRPDGSWRREFTNALIVLNPDNDETDSPRLIDVSAFPGGAGEWKRFIGSQDSSHNDGTDASSDFLLDPIDAIVLVRKSWYDAL